jgi:hypothetical protein
MIAMGVKRVCLLVLVASSVGMLVFAGGAHAATAPVKEVLASHVGLEVNATTKGNVCTVASKDECQRGLEGSGAGVFSNPVGVAVQTDPKSPRPGDVYVADKNNNRVQELTAAGVFVSAFGEAGSQAGQLSEDVSIAVDAATGNVWVQDLGNHRVEEYTPEGGFVLMVGREVNQTKDGTPGASEAEMNLCTAASGNLCKAGVPATEGGREHGAFGFASGNPGGHLLAAGGPERLLYVGDGGRIQEFEAAGVFKREVSLAAGASVAALAVDEAGDLYVAYKGSGAVHKLGAGGEPLAEFPVAPAQTDGSVEVGSLALDFSGHLAVTAEEGFPTTSQSSARWFGSLLDAGTGHLVTQFTGWLGAAAFSPTGAMYGAASFNSIAGTGSELLVFTPVSVGELLTRPAKCVPGAEHETDATLDCTLNGVVDPWGVPATEVWFQWGQTATLGQETVPQPVPSTKAEGEEEPLAPVSALLEGLRPNEPVNYRVAARDKNVVAPELLTSETASLTTPTVAPVIVGEPSSSFVKASSAVLTGALNPENTNTRYAFQYGPCETLEVCPAATKTAVLESSVYGQIPTILEAAGLQPATTYRYRLVADDRHEVAGETQGGESQGPEASFTTAPAAIVHAETGPASAVTVTGAIVSGTVAPGGQPATYTFQLGVYEGAGTEYGTVFSGPTGAVSGPVPETLALTGLQPGTTYAYRIAIKSGYGQAVGAPVLFTTAGLPSVLFSPTPLGMLATPPIAFPPEAVVASTTRAVLTGAQKLARALRACEAKPRKQRAACRKQARRKYTKSKQANHRKRG